MSASFFRHTIDYCKRSYNTGSLDARHVMFLQPSPSSQSAECRLFDFDVTEMHISGNGCVMDTRLYRPTTKQTHISVNELWENVRTLSLYVMAVVFIIKQGFYF